MAASDTTPTRLAAGSRLAPSNLEDEFGVKDASAKTTLQLAFTEKKVGETNPCPVRSVPCSVVLNTVSKEKKKKIVR